MDVDVRPKTRAKPFILWVVFQWFIAAFMAVFLLAISTEVRRLGVANAPYGLFAATIMVVVATGVALSPPVFFRLPVILRAVAYVGILASIITFSMYLDQMNPVWERTPQGRREEAERIADAARERQIEVQAAQNLAAVQRQSAADTADSNKLKACTDLVPQLIEISMAGEGPEIIEINEVQNTSDGSGSLECLGKAITDRGQGAAVFELKTSPQGQKILSVRYPWGVH